MHVYFYIFTEQTALFFPIHTNLKPLEKLKVVKALLDGKADAKLMDKDGI